MTGKDAIQSALASTKSYLECYVGDYTDADLLVRPVPTANHAAWQIGHIIAGEWYMVSSQLPDAKYPELPAGFAETHDNKNAGADGPAGFLTKAEYLSLFDQVRAATLAAIAGLSDADLDRPTTGGPAAYAPTLGKLLLLAADHTLMHAAQFSVVRRKLGKPIVF